MKLRPGVFFVCFRFAAATSGEEDPEGFLSDTAEKHQHIAAYSGKQL
jgi:hypothetical protein